MRALTTREKVLTGAVAVALAVALVEFLVLQPQERRLRQAQTRLTAAEQQLASLEPKRTALKALRREVLRREQQLAALNQRLSFHTELSRVVNQLTAQARNTGLHLQYLKPVRTETMANRAGTSEEYRRRVLEFGIRCRYRELGEFLAALESQRFFLRVVGLEVNRAEVEQPTLDVRLEVAAVVRSQDG
jgi:Tfp pilus assembly protein PilO